MCASCHNRTPLDPAWCHWLRTQLASILIVWIANATEHIIAMSMMSYSVAAVAAKLNRVERLAMLALLANVLHCRNGRTEID